MNLNRVFKLNPFDYSNGVVVYWMSRDQRIEDNWALIFAQELACKHQQPLIIVFTLVPNFLNASVRHFAFMLNSLEKEANHSFTLNIPFRLLIGNPTEAIINFLAKINAGALITDFDPLNIKRKWKDEVNRNIIIPFFEVDAHNIVPCRFISNKEEFAAFTLRPKIHRALEEFLDDFPSIIMHKFNNPKWYV